VQDAAFLERVQRQAQELGLRGWVRNTQDGRVETLLEGEAEAVRRMIEWFFNDSSSGVEVHATSVYQETPSPDLVGFEIRQT
jgi:acylphosphatase